MSHGPRRRTRSTPCSIKNCPNQVHRRSAFHLCTQHLISIWEFVGDDGLPAEMRDRSFFQGQVPPSTQDHVLTHHEMEARRLARKAATLRAAKRTGTIYVLDTRNELLKIGWTSRDVHQRLAQYPPNFRLIITTPGTQADERDVHRSLRLSRAAGREWYNLTPEVARQINEWVALANMRRARRNSDEVTKVEDWKEFAGIAHPWGPDIQSMLPRFESVEQWFANAGSNPTASFKTRPAPKSRPAARRA